MYFQSKMALMTSYLVTIATDRHSTYLKMRSRDERTSTEKNSEKPYGGGIPPCSSRVKN